MDAIILRPDLLEALEKNACVQTKSVSDLVNEAVARYLLDLQRAKLAEEIGAYENRHRELKKKYLGQWVAIHLGQLVDRDANRSELYRRVRERYGRTSVLIRQVREEAVEEIRWRGGSLRELRAY